VRSQSYALAVAQVGSEAVLKLFPEPEPHPRVFDGLVRFLDLLEGGIEDGPDPVTDGVGLGFQLKLLALAGYLPHLDSCAGCGSGGALVGYSAAAGGAVCGPCATEDGAFRLRSGSLAAVAALVDRPLAAGPLPTGPAADAVRVVETTYEYHGGFRLRTLHA
jgi:DNA repair protein RecO (recombination protein O)